MQWGGQHLLLPRMFQTRSCHNTETAPALPLATEPHVIAEVASHPLLLEQVSSLSAP